MNFKKFINSDYLKSNPLCGIDTYKDELNLATGACTRPIKKLMLTGDNTENWQVATGNAPFLLYLDDMLETASGTTLNWLSNQYVAVTPSDSWSAYDYCITSTVNRQYLRFRDVRYNSLDNFKAYLAQQYTAGTPVTIWYVLGFATTETITVPSGLSGTEEGYLNQSGTPTPTNPIYPTANTVEKWFDLNHHIMGVSDWQTVARTHERSGGQWD